MSDVSVMISPLGVVAVKQSSSGAARQSAARHRAAMTEALAVDSNEPVSMTVIGLQTGKIPLRNVQLEHVDNFLKTSRGKMLMVVTR
jgi:hypothetical protein